LDEGQIIRDYSIEKRLYRGVDFNLYIATYTPLNKKVTLKAFPRAETDKDVIVKELKLYSSIDSIFLPSLIEYIEDVNGFYFIFDYFNGETLFQFIKKTGPLRDSQTMHIFVQIMSALNYFHNTLKKIHGCITLDNILINQEGNIYFVNLGMGTSSSILGTEKHDVIPFCSPEVIQGLNIYYDAIDIWSAGIILYALAMGRLPFNDSCRSQIATKIVYQEPYYPLSLTPSLVDLIKRMLIKKYNQRVNLEYVIHHKWITRFPDINNIFYRLNVCEQWARLETTEEEIMENLSQLDYDQEKIKSALSTKRYNCDAAPYRVLLSDHVSRFFRTYFRIPSRGLVFNSSTVPIRAQSTKLTKVSFSAVISNVVGKSTSLLPVLTPGSSTRRYDPRLDKSYRKKANARV
jgi:serine/threonine protein kinase